MKVLHLALNYEGQRQVALEKMLQSFGSYAQVSWYESWKANRIDQFHNAAVIVSDTLKPDLVFMQIQTDGVLTPEFVRRLTGFKINWSGDVRDPLPSWYIKMAPFMNATCFTNMTDVEILQQMGLRSEYLQIGFDPDVYSPHGKLMYTPPIVFMGNHYPNRFPESKARLEMVMRLRERYGNLFGVYGNGWPVGVGALDLLAPEAEAAAYRSCKVAISQNHFIRPRFTSDRMFRLMGSGACCLTQWYPEIEAEFSTDVHLAVWNTWDDLALLIDKMLDDDDKRIAMARAGANWVHQHHTWAARSYDIKRIMA